MTNEERRKLDFNKRVADEIAGRAVKCPHGHKVGQVVATAATKDGIVARVEGQNGNSVEVIIQTIRR